jgi:hypothetical protein
VSTVFASDEEEINPAVTRLMALQQMSSDYASSLIGTWLVNSEPLNHPNTYETLTEDGTCIIPSNTSVYNWQITSQAADVDIAVSGETIFPKLHGYVKSDFDFDHEDPSKAKWVILLSGTSINTKQSVWFYLTKHGEQLQGTRRYIGIHKDKSGNEIPCFLDFKVTATKTK